MLAAIEILTIWFADSPNWIAPLLLIPLITAFVPVIVDNVALAQEDPLYFFPIILLTVALPSISVERYAKSAFNK